MGFLTTHYNNYNNSYPSQTLQTIDNSETITFQHHEQQQLFELSQQNYDFSSSFLDETLFFSSLYFYSNENYPCEDQLIIDSTFSCDQNDGFVSMNDIFPDDENFNNYVLPCPKRQKLAEAFSGSNMIDVNVQCEKNVSERSISTQSIAARERRRKIIEKTQELGKLVGKLVPGGPNPSWLGSVPGGPKMNTAEMLNAAFNYVRFLQTQVGMLQLMETFSKEENEPPPPSGELHKLVVFRRKVLYFKRDCHHIEQQC
ncbi:hypothetical protein RYX36_023312 [Vicia faba]